MLKIKLIKTMFTIKHGFFMKIKVLVAIVFLFLASCQKEKSLLEDILTKETFEEYQEMDSAKKKQFEISIWCFYMYQHRRLGADTFNVQCETQYGRTIKFVDLRELKLKIGAIKHSRGASYYAFRFEPIDSFRCFPRCNGTIWENEWPEPMVHAVNMDTDSVIVKRNIEGYYKFVKEKFNEGSLKTWLLANKPFN